MFVGKEWVLKGWEMFWIWIDCYYSGDENDLELLVQFMVCVHCETVFCE